jgi:hypothetical protein
MKSLCASIAAFVGLTFVLGVTLGRSADAPAHPPVDQYGGAKQVTVSSGGPTFSREKVGNRWVLVTPEGHPFWMTSVYNVSVSRSTDERNNSYWQRVIKKYGDADLRWGPQQVRRLRSWGFNTLGEYSNKWTLPTTVSGGYTSAWNKGGKPPFPNPERMPAIPFIWPSYYSLRNQSNLAPGPVKEIIKVTDGHYRGYRGSFPDVFDPNFAIWLGAELKNYGTSPWLVGVSIDDADTLSGFGAGPDFDSGGKANPHLGFITLITPPTQAENKSLRLVYKDTKVYIKHALQQFLVKRHRTIAELNRAWGSNYTTWESDGGWPNGRGFLDENGKGAWIGTDAIKLSSARPAVRADLEAFLYEVARQYFSTVRTQVKQRMPQMLYLGPTTVGSWGAPSRPQVLKAAGEFVDVLRVSWSGQQDRLDFIAEHAGDVPLAIWLGAFANPDSSMYRYNKPWFSTQVDRGRYYEKTVSDLLNFRVAATGTHPFVGLQWWEFADNWREKANWGLVTLSDNAYDGREAVQAIGKDAWGFPTGGEERDYGDFLTTVRRANFSTLEYLSREMAKR